MNWLTWIIGLSLFITLTVQAVSFHRALICRQEAWLKSTELRTRALLSKAPSIEKAVHLSCKTSFLRREEMITWQRWEEPGQKIFRMDLKGKL
jgi:hypothetical protein